MNQVLRKLKLMQWARPEILSIWNCSEDRRNHIVELAYGEDRAWEYAMSAFLGVNIVPDWVRPVVARLSQEWAIGEIWAPQGIILKKMAAGRLDLSKFSIDQLNSSTLAVGKRYLDAKVTDEHSNLVQLIFMSTDPSKSNFRYWTDSTVPVKFGKGLDFVHLDFSIDGYHWTFIEAL